MEVVLPPPKRFFCELTIGEYLRFRGARPISCDDVVAAHAMLDFDDGESDFIDELLKHC